MDNPCTVKEMAFYPLLGDVSGEQSHLIKSVSSMEDDGWQEQIEKDLQIKGLL